jgi:hypothetical protein
VKRLFASASLAALALSAPLSAPPSLPFGTAQVLAQAAVTIENISFKGDAGSVTIPRMVVEGSSASQADIQALFDPKSTATLAARLAQLSARSVTIPSIDVTQTMPQASGMTSYKNLVLRDIRGGVAAEATIEQVSTSVKAKADAKDTPNIDMTTGAVTMKGIDLGLFARFVFDKAQPGETLKVAVAEQKVGQTRYKIGNAATVTIAEISSTDLRLKPLKTPMAEIKALAERQAQGGQKPDPQASLGMAADILGSMSFGEIRMKGLTGDATPPNKPAVRFSLDQMVMAGGAGQSRFQMQGFKAGSGADRFDMAEVAVEGVDLGATLAALQGLASQDGGMSNFDPATMIPKIGAVRFGGLDIDVPDMKNVGQRVRAKLGLFETRMANHVGPIPADVAVTLDRLQMDIPANTQEKGLQDILAMGYKALDLSAKYDQTWNESAKTLTIREMSLRSGGMATMTAKAEIGNVPREIFTLDKAVSSVAALGAAARSLQVSLVNDSLFEKLIAKTARDSRRKAEDVRAELAAGATMMVPMLLGDHPAARPIGAALGKFVAEPKNLRIEVKAKGEGLGATDFLAVSNPMDLLKKVDITATANQ